jgi:hypothetical protein
MSDTTEAHLAALRIRQRDLELEATAIRARVEELRECIALLEGPRRRPGRPRSRSSVIEMPERVEGGVAGADASLAGLDDVRGILRTEETAA